MIKVLFHGEDDHQHVPDYALGQLIATGRIKAFLRSTGWVTIGRDPIREAGRVSYYGPERRKRRTTSCMSCPDMQGGTCISTTCPSRTMRVKFFSLS